VWAAEGFSGRAASYGARPRAEVVASGHGRGRAMRAVAAPGALGGLAAEPGKGVSSK